MKPHIVKIVKNSIIIMKAMTPKTAVYSSSNKQSYKRKGKDRMENNTKCCMFGMHYMNYRNWMGSAGCSGFIICRNFKIFVICLPCLICVTILTAEAE